MKLLEGFNRLRKKILPEDLPSGVTSQVLVMRATGLWPTADNPRWYRWLTITLFAFAGIVFPLSLLANIIFATTIQAAMDHLFFSLTCWTVTFKAIVIYRQHNAIRENIRIHAELQRSTVLDDSIARTNLRIHIALFSLYFAGWCAFLAQIFSAPPTERNWLSTTLFPFAFAQRPSVYVAVLVLQALGNLCLTIWVAIEDSLYIALMNIACGHLTQLKERLMRLNINDDTHFYAELIDCCECYGQCLRCDLWDDCLQSFLIQFDSLCFFSSVCPKVSLRKWTKFCRRRFSCSSGSAEWCSVRRCIFWQW